MGRRFRGESHHKVDSKGRVSIPASFRRVLQAEDPNCKGDTPELVIVYGGPSRQFLECYTMRAVEEIDAQIDAMPRGAPERRALEQLFYTQSIETSVDPSGRLVLPAKLRQQIGLDGEAFFASRGEKFQIWNPETYKQEELAKTQDWLAEQGKDFDPLIFLDGTKGE